MSFVHKNTYCSSLVATFVDAMIKVPFALGHTEYFLCVNYFRKG